MNARLAFTAISEIPLFGSRAAASCCRRLVEEGIGVSSLDAAEVFGSGRKPLKVRFAAVVPLDHWVPQVHLTG